MNNNKVKICPLAWAQPCERDRICNCQEELCAWYVPAQRPGVAGRCAVQMLGLAMPELVRGVKGL